MTSSYTLLTFFKFVDVPHPSQEVAEHLALCTQIGLKGRIYIGTEGISSTVSGQHRQLRAYRHYLEQHPLFHSIPDIDIKASEVPGHVFDRMIVKLRKEIVALGEVVTQSEVETYQNDITPEEMNEIMARRDHDEKLREEVAILDMRNTYEYKLGHFKGALPAGTINFRETKDLLAKYKETFKNKKKVIMYCTGHIRCAKLSVLLGKEGINNIYGLNGGIVKYTNTYNDGARLGNLYTFDGVISKKIGDEHTHVTIGKCIYSGFPTDHCENCRYSPCNARIICKPQYYKKFGGFCSQECFENAKKDILIKDIDRDPMNYQNMRIQLRRKENFHKKDQLLQQFSAQVTQHLDTLLEGKNFPHLTSQKEDIVDRELIENTFGAI